MFEWVITEAIAVRSINENGTQAIIECDDLSKSVVVSYRRGHGPDVIFFNDEPYIIGEPAAECLVTWMHTASQDHREVIDLKASEWDEVNGPLDFYRMIS